MPLTEENLPDLDSPICQLTQTLFDEYKTRRASEQDIVYDPPCLSTRVLLASLDIKRSDSPVQRMRTVEGFMEHDFWRCLICRNNCERNNASLSFRQIEDQLFPSVTQTNKPLVEPMLGSTRTDELLEELQRRGYSVDEVMALFRESTPAEIDGWDVDFARAILESRNDSRAAPRRQLDLQSLIDQPTLSVKILIPETNLTFGLSVPRPLTLVRLSAALSKDPQVPAAIRRASSCHDRPHTSPHRFILARRFCDS